jgi:hypothetical protein
MDQAHIRALVSGISSFVAGLPHSYLVSVTADTVLTTHASVPSLPQTRRRLSDFSKRVLGMLGRVECCKVVREQAACSGGGCRGKAR